VRVGANQLIVGKLYNKRNCLNWLGYQVLKGHVHMCEAGLSSWLACQSVLSQSVQIQSRFINLRKL